MSGRSSSTWLIRSSGNAIPGEALTLGSASAGEKRAPIPVVRLMTTGLPASRMRPTTSR